MENRKPCSCPRPRYLTAFGRRTFVQVICVLSIAAVSAFAALPNYVDGVRPLFARRCFGCCEASEMRSGLSPLTQVAAPADRKLGIAGDYEGRIPVSNVSGLVYIVPPPGSAAKPPSRPNDAR